MVKKSPRENWNASDIGRRMTGGHQFKLSDFGTVKDDTFTIRGPEMIKGSGIRIRDIAIAAAAAGAIYYQMGKDGKKIKTPSPSSDVSVPTQLQGKRTPTQLRGKSSTPNNSSKSKGNPLDKFKTKPKAHDSSREKLAHGGPVKKYARGGGIRKAKSYDY